MKKIIISIITILFITNSTVVAYTEKLQKQVDNAERFAEYAITELFSEYKSCEDKENFVTNDLMIKCAKEYNAMGVHFIDGSEYSKNWFLITTHMQIETSYFQKNQTLYCEIWRVHAVSIGSYQYEYWVLTWVKQAKPNCLDYSLFYIVETDTKESKTKIIQKSNFFIPEYDVEGGKIKFPMNDYWVILRMEPWRYPQSYRNCPELYKNIIRVKYFDAKTDKELNDKESTYYDINGLPIKRVPYKFQLTEKELNYYRKCVDKFKKTNGTRENVEFDKPEL